MVMVSRGGSRQRSKVSNSGARQGQALVYSKQRIGTDIRGLHHAFSILALPISLPLFFHGKNEPLLCLLHQGKGPRHAESPVPTKPLHGPSTLVVTGIWPTPMNKSPSSFTLVIAGMCNLRFQGILPQADSEQPYGEFYHCEDNRTPEPSSQLCVEGILPDFPGAPGGTWVSPGFPMVETAPFLIVLTMTVFWRPTTGHLH